MKGNPQFKIGDVVNFGFEFDDKPYSLSGVIRIVDAYGTWDDDSNVCYDIEAPDIFNEKVMCLYKHINENDVK